MRIFFVLLLIANILFGLMQWLVPHEQLISNNKHIPVAEPLYLLDELEKPAQQTTAAETPKQQTPDQQTVTETDRTPLCYITGPFRDKNHALEISAKYSANAVKNELKSIQEQEYQGVMVYLPGHKSREAAINSANKLAKAGFRDSLIINEGDKTNALSLGVFGLKKNADRLISRLKRLHYPVKSELRYRQRNIFWIYSELSDDSNSSILLDSKDKAKGINQLNRECT